MSDSPSLVRAVVYLDTILTRGRAHAMFRAVHCTVMAPQRFILDTTHLPGLIESMRMVQRELHQQLRAESVATREKIASLLRPLNPSQLNEHPEPSGWSVGQVLEHLCIADEVNDERFAALLRNSRQDAGAPAREWKSSLLGGLIAGSLLKPKALPAPKAFRPGPTPRNGVVEALLGREMTFVKAMDDTASFDWRALRIASPALPSWAPTMNLGDGFRIHVVHVTRHARQLERLAGML